MRTSRRRFTMFIIMIAFRIQREPGDLARLNNDRDDKLTLLSVACPEEDGIFRPSREALTSIRDNDGQAARPPLCPRWRPGGLTRRTPQASHGPTPAWASPSRR